jgi:hypothetical protein
MDRRLEGISESSFWDEDARPRATSGGGGDDDDDDDDDGDRRSAARGAACVAQDGRCRGVCKAGRSSPALPSIRARPKNAAELPFYSFWRFSIIPPAFGSGMVSTESPVC